MDHRSYGEDKYDSDLIDEETESRLYSAVFFDKQMSYNSVLEQTKPLAPSFSYLSESYRSPVSEHVDNQNDSVTDALTNSAREKTISSEDECEKSGEYLLNSSSSSGCSVVLCGDDDSNKATVSPRGVVLGVSHDTLLHIQNEHSPLHALEKTVPGDDADIWKICNADRQSSRSSDARYFNSLDDSLCSECGDHKGRAHRCHRVCIFCGEEGHEKDQCDKVYCYACFAPGHSKNECHLLKSLKKSKCERCGQQGHISTLCTELWRQYRNTTTEGKPVRLHYTVQSKGCCNCGRMGHTVEDCRCRPFRSQFLGPLPKRRVTVYDKKDIYESLRSDLARVCATKKKRKKKEMEISEEAENNNHREAQKISKPQKAKKKKGKKAKAKNLGEGHNGNNLQRKIGGKQLSRSYLEFLASLRTVENEENKSEEQRSKSQPANSNFNASCAASSSSYNYEANESDFRITQRTKKKWKMRSKYNTHKASSSQSSMYTDPQSSFSKSKKRKHS
uniref:Zinc finger CCHC domain-containing protein 7 n=1 Tax=Trichobilharzia regenti TaxID=157069 RepID=A0AA85J8L3_TRIRE|nr:unnamed protein product [Trichobilharzia regenti]